MTMVLYDLNHLGSKKEVNKLLADDEVLVVCLPPLNDPNKRLDEILRLCGEQDNADNKIEFYYSAEIGGMVEIGHYIAHLELRRKYQPEIEENPGEYVAP